jgi:hypothetical protein
MRCSRRVHSDLDQRLSGMSAGHNLYFRPLIICPMASDVKNVDSYFPLCQTVRGQVQQVSQRQKCKIYV